MDAIDNGTQLLDEWLEAVAEEDGLFPLLNAADWVSTP
jgi:predicted RNase H-like HicB family nuclease